MTFQANALTFTDTGIAVGSNTANVSLDISAASDAIALPLGPSSERPNAQPGYIRYNTTINQFEGGYANNEFLPFAAGNAAPGGANTQIQYNNNGTLAGNAGLTFNVITQSMNLVGQFITPTSVLGYQIPFQLFANTTYYKIATLFPNNSPSGADSMTICGTFGYISPSYYEISMGNRGTLNIGYRSLGPQQTSSGIACYQEANSSVSVYIKCNPTYTTATIDIIDNYQEILYIQNLIVPNTNPSGTLIYDTTSNNYPPLLSTDSTKNLHQIITANTYAYSNQGFGVAGLVITNGFGIGQAALEFNDGFNVNGRVRCDYISNMFYTANGGSHYFNLNGDFGAVGNSTVAVFYANSNSIFYGTVTSTSAFIQNSPNFEVTTANQVIVTDGTDNQFRKIGANTLIVGGVNIQNIATGVHDVAILNSSTQLAYSTNFYLNSATGQVSAVSFNSTSDATKKINIRKMTDAQNIIASLNGVRFDWKDNNLPSAGIIAQDLELVLPECVSEAKGTKGVNYAGVIGALVEEVKSLRIEIEKLKNESYSKKQS